MDSAAVIVCDRDGRVLLLQRGPTAPQGALEWNLPGGIIEPGEVPEDTARREAREEAALRVAAMVPLARVKFWGGVFYVFGATAWSGRVQLLDGEHVAYAWVPREQLAAWNVISVQRPVLSTLAALPRIVRATALEPAQLVRP